MRNASVFMILIAILGFSLTGAFAGPALADGTETLASPDIVIESGTGVVAAGVGLVVQPGTINITVPSGATVKQVLLYWEGQMKTDLVGDNTITVNGNEVTGALIGGQTFFFVGGYSSAFRADITSLNLIGPGANALTLSGLQYTNRNNGAGVMVIYDDGSRTADIQVRDGLDLAFYNFPEPRKNTIPQTFTFEPADFERVATLALFFSSISNDAQFRPNSLEVTVGTEKLIFSNELSSAEGDEWDTVIKAITVPAGVTSLTIQAFSRDDTGAPIVPPGPASLAWIGATLAITPPPPPVAALGDRVWNDLNGNGIQEEGEPGVSGVTVKLLAPGDDSLCNTGDETELDSTTTNDAGIYGFADLEPGDYCVAFVAPDGFSFTLANEGSDDAADSDADALTGQTTTITLEAGETDLTWDAGLVAQQAGGEGCTPGYWKQKKHFNTWTEYKPYDSYKRVFGVHASFYTTLLGALEMGGGGERALARQAVAALLNASNPEVNYRYSASEVIAMVQEAYKNKNFEEVKNLFAAENEMGCSLLPPPAALGDRVWNDLNGNGIQDAGEPGVPGVTVKLLALGADGVCKKDHETKLATTTTDADGYYRFNDLPPGEYYVVFVAPTGFTFTTADEGSDDAADSDADRLSGQTTMITLEAGETDLTWDAGLVAQQAGGEGCTPGYWKQKKHYKNWVGYRPSDSYKLVFGVHAAFYKSLLDMMEQGGGGERALARQAVAALLNASNPEVNYRYTTEEVIAMVQEAYATRNFDEVKDLFEEQNQMSCPLN